MLESPGADRKPWTTPGGKISDDYLKSLLKEHEYTSQLVDRLRVVITASLTILPEDQKRRLMNEMLGTLVDRLYPHFAKEEEGGFLADVVERRPEWTDRVERLRNEHAILVNEFRGLLQQCHQMNLHNLQHAVAHAVDRYVHHEIEESHLIQRIYYDVAEAAD